MKRSMVFVLALVATLALSPVVHAVESGRVITGELVVTDAGANRFRIVGHDGSFTAPAGTSITALDGHTVQVELASNSRVTLISEAPVPINPIVHGWSTVRGQLVVTDAAARRFSFAGDNQTYVAPPTVDVAPYSGKMVEIKMDETGQVTELRLVSPSPMSSYGVPAPYVAQPTTCSYQGNVYSAGAAVCQSGTQYRCDGTQWQSLGTGCPQVSDARAVAPRLPRTCKVGDATVANGSGICRDGSTYRCDDGAWINSRTACR